MAAQAEAEEVQLELEAVAAVYGDDVRVLRDLPPHLVVHVRPRTADDSSQQFVELFLGIKASSQYPKEPPHIYAVESKGLDENRQSYLISSIQNKAKELSNYPMLVTLCEEAGEILSNMNHPAGDCPLCLYPLVGDDKDGSGLPFMKLMSCYHCFHSRCIMRWWEWLQHGDANPKEHNTGGKHYNVNQHKGFCPVCRKVFDEKDIEHVHDLLGESTSQLASWTLDLGEDEKELLRSEAEQIRRKRIESLVNLQQERNGLIEPKKDLAIQPGMYVTLPPSTPDTAAGESTDPNDDTTTSTSETEQCSQANITTSNKPKNSGNRRRNRANALRRQSHGQPVRQQWQRKEADSSHQ
ncbi:E3 ubiquitin-protein ligase RNF25 isoform X2 [Panicum virgatum]|uniref:E3 ubiquitin-protein ligase RNF25 n=1 Tax=Panicum virgatum TaxID=38727 RepID=A0A8T0P7V1_PANVG|nr:E3 ubiquitin-protein ligase RNF25 isoform X2 [Panicum virgatum]KAG2558257.1 hypothetical protein PVAP13_8NG178900 [Panicum virgatum]